MLVPSRELAMQTSLVIKNLSKHKKLECVVVMGGNNLREDFYRLNQTVHVLIATPGRLLDLASRNVANLDACKMLVLDEVDKLLSIDFSEIVERIISLMPKPQICLFSATYPVEIKTFRKSTCPSLPTSG